MNTETLGLSADKLAFKDPKEELAFLRSRIEEVASKIEGQSESVNEDEIISAHLKEYAERKPDETMEKFQVVPEEEAEAIVLNLAPEKHDDQIAELISILQQKGIINTIAIVQRMNNPHLEDDLHRFLVQYIKEGYKVKGLKEKTSLGKSLDMTLYEISLPEVAKDDEKKELKNLISAMEQFYAGMLSVSNLDKKERNYFTLEIALANDKDEVVFYSAVPNSRRDLFEKQVLSLFPGSKVIENKNEYNIFHEEGVTVASEAKLASNPIFPLKMYDKFDYDPLNVILNSFSKMKKQGEGAALQLVFSPAGDFFVDKYKDALEKILKGTPVKEAIDLPQTITGELFKTAKDMFVGKKDKDEEKKIDDLAMERIKEKVSSPIVSTNIRLVCSAEDKGRAKSILQEIESSFNQFENSGSNKVIFDSIKNRRVQDFLYNFTFRILSDKDSIPLSIRELTTMLHFPSSVIKSDSQLKKERAKTAPAPLDLPQEGILLGVNGHRGMETEVHFLDDDRMRHFYVIGQTGTGKSTLLKNMITQDIIDGRGVCMIDPHGSDLEDILSIVPKSRIEDVIYFDPAYIPRPMGLNMLEYDENYPEQKTFVVNELLSIFNKLFDMKVAGGPMFEQYFRNAALLVMDDPSSGNTLIDLAKVLTDKRFRDQKLKTCKNLIVVEFWKEVAEKAGGESSLQNIVPYITNKFDTFISNEIMRPVIAQKKSAFNFREIMDEKKILLVNLSKGRLGELNANLIGLIIVGKILMAALSRVDSFGKDLPPFYLYIDEFQNVTTDSIATILSEARKYKLSLNIAHQYIKQLEEKIKDAVFGNVGSICSFRTGPEDSEFLAKQFEPVFSATDIMNVDNRNAYLKFLINGKPTRPFNISTAAPLRGTDENIELVKNLSYIRFGKDRNDIEAEIMQRYRKEEDKRTSPFDRF
jgi:hypothetical protein